MPKKKLPDNKIAFYQTPDGSVNIEVFYAQENIWLTQKRMAELFDTTVPNINMHLKNIFKQGELAQNSVIKDFLITASDGKKYKTKFYSLEAIVAVGYRVNSERGTQFRQWATRILKNYYKTMRKSKELIKQLNRICICCGKKIKIMLYKNRGYQGGHYFGKLLKNAEYWECDKCYRGVELKSK